MKMNFHVFQEQFENMNTRREDDIQEEGEG